MPVDVARIEVRSEPGDRARPRGPSALQFDSLFECYSQRSANKFQEESGFGARAAIEKSQQRGPRASGGGGSGGGGGEKVTERSEYWLSPRASTSLKLLDCIRMAPRLPSLTLLRKRHVEQEILARLRSNYEAR